MYNISSLARKHDALRMLFVLVVFLWGMSGSALADDTTAPTLNDSSYYEISTAAHLKWFANKVNSGDQNINGVLTADINLSDLNEAYWTPIADYEKYAATYGGKFNGQNHVISGLVVRPVSGSGLFCAVKGAAISNLVIEGATLASDLSVDDVSSRNGLAVICAFAHNSVFSNCHVKNVVLDPVSNWTKYKITNLGGILGVSVDSKVINSSVSGYLVNKGAVVGGIAGYSVGGQYESCQILDHVTGNSKIEGSDKVGAIVGCLEGRTAEMAVIGCSWADNTRVTATEGLRAGYQVGFDSLPATPVKHDDYYEIYTPDQLQGFSSIVNGGETSAKAKLMNDLNMSQAGVFTPIGTKDNSFAGVFEGNKYTIDSLTVNNQEYAGLFGYVKDGSIKSVTLTHPLIHSNDCDYQGFIAGFLTQNEGHDTPVGYIENCHVTNGDIPRSGYSPKNYIGGIVGKMDMSAEVRDCSFKGAIEAHNNYIGGIAGCMDSGSKMYRCSTLGASKVKGNNYIGGVVGYMTDTHTLIDNCFADESTGDVNVECESGNYSGKVKGYDNSGEEKKSTYVEEDLVYTLTGKKISINGKEASEAHITGTSTTGKGAYHAVVDIGTASNYFTTEIESMPGVEELSFWDNNSNVAGTTACGWINMKIDDRAFDRNFKSLKLCYKMFAGDDHTVMLHPTDVYPAGDNMFVNCPDAKVYVEAEYYDEFCNDANWSKYKSHLVRTTDMREADFTVAGAYYAHDRNSDATGTYITQQSTVSSSVNVRQVHVTGCDNSIIAEKKGALKLYQDMGEIHAYNTTRVWDNAFKGNTAITNVSFEEMVPNANQTYTDFNIQLGDSCFANCANLTQFDLVLASDGDHYLPIHPSQIPLGKGVFDGTSNMKIRIPTSVIGEFRIDNTYGWAEYKNLFEAHDFDVTAYTEDGVKYSYYVSEKTKKILTSKDKSEMESVVTPWLSKYRGFKATDVLCPNFDGTLYYMRATGIDDAAIDKAGGVMKLYNDIGNSKNYKTIELSSTAFQNNEHIKQIIFEDCAGSSGNANTDLSFVIPDSTFKGCKNLKELSMYYLATKGTNHYEAIKPSQIFVGEHAFDDVDPEFRILVLPDLYADFITDANWSQYKDHIVASTYVPINEEAKNVDGVTYDFAATALNTIPTSETVHLQSSYFNILTIALFVAKQLVPMFSTQVDMATKVGTYVFGNEYPAGTLLDYGLMSGESIWGTTHNVSFFRYCFTPGAKLGTVNLYHGAPRSLFFDGLIEGEAMLAGGSYTRLYGKFLDLIYDRLFLASVTTLMDATAMTAYSISSSTNNAINYIANRAAKNYYKKSTAWELVGGFWLRVEKRTNVPHMYVKNVANNDSIIIYNDPGEESQDYLTVAVSNDAFHGKDKIKKVSFVDRKGRNTESLNSMCMHFPDSCFAGCTSLRELNLVMTSYGGNNGVMHRQQSALTPDNFVLAGDIFNGLDSIQRSKIKIIVGEDVLDDFKSDSYWSKYSSMFHTQSVHRTIQSCEGISYVDAMDNNTFPRRTEVGTHTIDHTCVIGPTTYSKYTSTYFQDYHGHALLTNDYGTYANSKLDYVKARAFKNNDAIRTLDFQDMSCAWGDTYCDLNLELRDSAFAYCPNFTDLNLNYQVYDGDNHCEAVTPEQVTLGKGVFDGCDKLRIKFWLDQESAFRADTAWNKYADKFVPCFFEAADTKVAKLLYDDWHIQAWDQGDNTPEGSNFDAIDAIKSTPDKLQNLFRGTDIQSFEEFRAFGHCGLKEVYPEMFQNCTQLQMIQLPSQIKTVGDRAFQNCKVLNSITLPDSIEKIGEDVFSGSSIKTIYCENPVPASTDAKKAFAGLPSDYVIYVPDTVVATYKEKWADVAEHINGLGSKPSTLKIVHLTQAGTLADSLGLKYDYSTFGTTTLWGNYARYDSLRISGPLNSDDIAVIRYMGGRDVDNNKKSVGRLQYLDLYDADLVDSSSNPYNCATLNEKKNWKNAGVHHNNRISDNNCVSSQMFIGLDQLRTLILPKSATKICDQALSCMSNLQTLVIGDNVTEIENYAGCECPNLTYLVMLPETVPESGSYAFSKCMTTLKYLPNDILGFTDETTHIPFILTSRESLAKYSGAVAFNTAADSIGAFYADDHVLEIMKEHHVFSPIDMMGMTDISNMVNNNSQITSFNELYITKVKKLDKSSLSHMKALESTTLPYMCDSITSDAFEGCSNLHTIWSCNDSVPALGDYAFNDLPTNFVVMVPNDAVNRYRAAWAYYKNHIQGYYPDATVTREVNLTVPGTLADSLGLEVVTDGRYVTAINGKMSDIHRLRITGPITSKDIAVLRMLAGCDYEEERTVYTTNLQYLDLYDANIVADPDKIYYTTAGNNQYVSENNEVPKKMFRKCNHLQTVILPRTITKICDEAFYNMYSLNTLVIGDDCNDVDGNDAFGKSHNLKTMIFLCDKKPELNHDAFTDPVEGDVYKIDNMYVRHDIINDYTSDKQYTQHANHISNVFADDNVFRAWGCKAVATKENLSKVDSIHGWFDSFPRLTDLSTLGETSVTDLRTADVKTLAGLRCISLPSTLSKIEQAAFAYNKELAWADLTKCDSLNFDVDSLGVTPWTLVYAPENVTGSDQPNVVYTGADGLECAHYNLTGTRDYDVPKAFTAQGVTFDRTYAKGNAYTLALPFDCPVPKGVNAYKHNVEGASDAVYFYEVDKIEANKPYALTVTADNVKFDFTDSPTKVIATPARTGQSKGNVHTLTATFSRVSHDNAVAQQMLVMDTTAVWNMVKADTTHTKEVLPFTVYAQAAYKDAPTVDVNSTFTMVAPIYVVSISENIDNAQTLDMYDTETVNMSINRTLVADKWNTLCVPFSVDIADTPLAGAKVMALTEIDGNNLKFSEVDCLKAGESYLVKPNGSDIVNPTFDNVTIENTIEKLSGDYDFIGTYSPMYVDDSKTTYLLNSDGNLELAPTGTELYATHAYFKASSENGGNINLYIGDDIITAIHSTSSSATKPFAIYGIDGTYKGTNFNILPKGVYIVNGKKILK